MTDNDLILDARHCLELSKETLATVGAQASIAWSLQGLLRLQLADHNGTPSGRCCVCLNTKSRPVAATHTAVFQLCDDHTGADIAALLGRKAPL